MLSRSQHRHSRVRGATLTEVLAAAIIVAFLTTATAALITVGERQDRTTRFYSYGQTDIRTAMRTIGRTLRHAYLVRASGTLGTLNGVASNASQVVCEIPQASGSSNIEILFYMSGGTVYYQRSTDAAPGTALLTGASGMAVAYYTTTSGTTTTATTPDQATEIQITLTATRGSVTTSAPTYVMMRNH
jgi:hypothetical protein